MKYRNPQVLDTVAAVVRCVVLLTATLLTRAGAYSALTHPWLDLFLAAGGVYILATTLAQRAAPRYRPETAALVSLDVFYITGLVWLTGGLRSEYYLLYYLPILNASMRLHFKQAVLSSILAGACYALVATAQGLESQVTNSAALQLATFGGSAMVLALFFGTVAALSSNQRELTDKLQHTVERLSALYRIARSVHARDSLQSVVDTTLELALELSRARVGYLALTNPTGELLVKSSRTASGEPQPAEGWAFDRHLAEHCLVRRASLVTDEKGDHPDLGRTIAACCVACVPLMHAHRVFGALQLFNRPGEVWSEHEVELLGALAQEASVAIENARLMTEVRRLSVTDDLTGLYHRGEFRRLLAAEVEAARTSGAPLALLLFDIDGMRQVNAELGHGAGDQVLLAFADLLRRYVRSEDIVARYGGDEFAVLLPRGGLDAARAVSARVGHALARRAFHFEGEDCPRHFTLSAGGVVVAHMPNNPDQLVGRADEALFVARRAGPGQVRFWEATVQRGIVTHVRQMVEQVQDASDQWR